MMMSGPGKPQLTPQSPGAPASPPPHLRLSRILSTLWSISISFPQLQSPYPSPPSILIKTQGILEVKGPHLVSSVCPPHSTDGETEAERAVPFSGSLSESVAARTSGPSPRSPTPHCLPCGWPALSRPSERTSCERGAPGGEAGCWAARSRPA